MAFIGDTIGGLVSGSLAPAANVMHGGDELRPGQSVASPNGRVRLMLQTDGNLVLYAADGRALWSNERTDFDGEFSTLRNARCDPKPLQRAPRIWVGAKRNEKCGALVFRYVR